MEKSETTLTRLRAMVGDDGAGGRLPPERVLSARLGVGRRTVRRALDVLEGEGRVRRRQGQGTFVAADGAGGLGLDGIAAHTNPIEDIEVRLAIEPLIARLAAIRASRADIERLGQLCEATRAARNAADYERADAAFHRRLAEAARNVLLLTVFEAVSALRRDPSWQRLGENGRCFKRQATYSSHHREIVAAVAARDGDRAQAAMFHHLADVQQRIFEHAFPPLRHAATLEA